MANNITRTMNQAKQNPKADNYWELALDIGYSSVKGMAPNKYFLFPSFAKRLNSESDIIGNMEQECILYRNEKGELWCVGAEAQNMISPHDTNDSVQYLYGRNRYMSPMFRVITEVGLALGLKSNHYGYKKDTDELMVQTGLPTLYMGDEMDLKESLCGTHSFSIKVGNGEWEQFYFDLPISNIDVMEQPMGTLYSISKDSKGNFVPMAKRYTNSSILILDIGFGTFDTFAKSGKIKQLGETESNLAMRQVFQLTSDKIYQKYKTRIPVAAMQKYLETGEITVTDKKNLKSHFQSFEDILLESSFEVCSNMLERVKTSYDIFDFAFLVITGGTGDAWSKIIKDHFSGLDTLTVLMGNQNDTDLPSLFANVRGYYMYLHDTLKLKNRNANR